MRRREALAVLLVLGAGLDASCAIAQAKRIAFLGVEPADSPGGRRLLEGFRSGLISEGISADADVAIDYVAEPAMDRVAAALEALTRRRPTLIVAITTPVAQAAAKAAGAIPVLFGTVSDPVGSGLVASLARPGGNITGVSNMLPALSGKLLEFARDLVPGITGLAVLWNSDNPAKALEAAELRAAATKLGVALQELPVRSLRDVESALAAGARDRQRVLVILAETFTHQHRARIGELAEARRLVVISNLWSHAEAGGVLSYQPSYAVLNRRLGAMAARILRGAQPSDIPVELPTTFELLVNIKAARGLGLAVPRLLLARADRVIE